MSLILLNNNTYNYTPEHDLTLFYGNEVLGFAGVSYAILVSNNSRPRFTRNIISTPVILTNDSDGNYNPQSFGNAITYGLNSNYILRPCYWTTDNIVSITFLNTPFYETEPIPYKVDGTLVADTLYITNCTVTIVNNVNEDGKANDVDIIPRWSITNGTTTWVNPKNCYTYMVSINNMQLCEIREGDEYHLIPDRVIDPTNRVAVAQGQILCIPVCAVL